MGNTARLHRCLSSARTLVRGGTPAVRRYGAWLLALAALGENDAPAARASLEVLGGLPGLLAEPLMIGDVADEVAMVRLASLVGAVADLDGIRAAAERRRLQNPDVHTIAGTAAQVSGLVSGERDPLTEAVRQFETGPRPLLLASALEDESRSAVVVDDRRAAVDGLGRALELYSTAGADRDAARVRSELRELGVRRRLVPAARPATGWAGLTGAELEVVHLVARGTTNRQVAEQLFLSPHTVNSHLRHAFVKLGVNSRVELTRLALGHEDAGQAIQT
jgi:DNA-binding CsgD family transcriptional regulator